VARSRDISRIRDAALVFPLTPRTSARRTWIHGQCPGAASFPTSSPERGSAFALGRARQLVGESRRAGPRLAAEAKQATALCLGEGRPKLAELVFGPDENALIRSLQRDDVQP
jgi:hypothetical protein